jgi:queuine/archaeosine tRNA-ribosyltransferase
VRFFYADALDLVDPHFDFLSEESPRERTPQRDDVYAHELMAPDRPYDGLLVSKFLLDLAGGHGRYTQAQRFRFLREGARAFLRFPPHPIDRVETWPLLGDCGAFNYRDLEAPPYSTAEVLEFYQTCGFTHGVSVDHMIGAYEPKYDAPDLFGKPLPEACKQRYELTLHLADEFLRGYRAGQYDFQPLGVAQGWSPQSYREAVHQLMRMGYDYVALGGLVPLKTPEILDILKAVRDLTQGNLKLHLFGVTRLDNFDAYTEAGVVSLDSASPMRQAFKDARNNYYAPQGHFTAVRVPQADKYPKLTNLIKSGALDQKEAFKREEACLSSLRAYGRHEIQVEELIGVLEAYEWLYGGESRWRDVQRTLQERPWEQCPCPVCRQLGIDVVIFRGANRNRRRGFHNLWVTQRTLQAHRSRIEESG